MGWLSNDLQHEGFIVAVDPDDRHRELGLEDCHRADVRVNHVRVGCDCGWRSSTLVAPFGAVWFPCTVMFSAFDEERIDAIAHGIWRDEHLAHVTTRSTFALLDGLHPIGGRT